MLGALLELILAETTIRQEAANESFSWFDFWDFVCLFVCFSSPPNPI